MSQLSVQRDGATCEAAKPAPESVEQASTDGPPGEKGFVFIASNRRSGSTWLSWMLNEHPEVLIQNEGWLLNPWPCSLENWLEDGRLQEWARGEAAKGGYLKVIPADKLRTLLLRGMAEAIMRERARLAPWKDHRRLRVIGDKTTTAFCTKAEFLHELFPDARYIHIVRDGRDVCVSDMFFQFRYRAFDSFPGNGSAHARLAYRYHVEREGPEVPLFDRDTLAHLAKGWAECVRGARRARELFGERYHEVRYEELLADPYRLRETLAFLGVASHHELVERCVEKHRFERQTKGRRPGEARPLEMQRKGVAGDWRNYFKKQDMAVFKEVAGEQLIESGYERSDDW